MHACSFRFPYTLGPTNEQLLPVPLTTLCSTCMAAPCTPDGPHACGWMLVQAPTTAVINEVLTEPGVNISQTYTYCVSAQGSATSDMIQVVDGMLHSTHYVSAPTCVNKTIEWAGTIVVNVHTKQGTPVPGVNVSAWQTDFGIDVMTHCTHTHMLDMADAQTKRAWG